jgi:6-phosphogluconolactonase
MAEIIICDQEEWLKTAVRFFIQQSAVNIADHGSFSVALAGGSTPAALYSELARPENQVRVDWEKVHLFWGDERHVPPDDPQSNFRMVKKSMLEAIPIPEENIHRVQAEMDVRLAAFAYEEELRGFFSSEWPRFDLVFLGMGADGHTASLFPHSMALNEESRWFVANAIPDKGIWRLTLTMKAINAARMVLVLVRGESKADRLKTVLTGEKDPWEMPVQAVNPVDGMMIWLVDREAGSQLPDGITL